MIVPGSASPLLLGGDGSSYAIQKSLRFRSSASAYLKRNSSVSSNQQTWTWSGWVKRGALGSLQQIFASDNSSTSQARLHFTASDTIQFISYISGFQVQLITTQVFRDPSAWYHIVLKLDTTNATSANRCMLYINGLQVTAFSTATYPAQNYNGVVNGNYPYYLGSYFNATQGEFLDGYLSEVNFIDGQALTPSSFGEYDTITGVWKAKKYAGTYGTNGFYLPFTDTSSTTNLVKDASGNANNWTPNNISLTAGVTYDSMLDSPTMGAAGTQPVGNYATLNPILENAWWAAPSRGTISYGNLRLTGQNGTAFSTFDVNTNDKWYFEIRSTTNQSISQIIVSAKSRSTFEVTYSANGQKVVNGSASSYGASWTNGDTIGIAIDRANNQITFYKNNVSQGAITNTFPAIGITVLGGYYSENTASDTVDFNFGQQPFAYTPPTGFNALCNTNLPDGTILAGNKYFDATLWTGNGSTQNIPTNFSPDLVWIKSRSVAYSNYIYDAIRGTNLALFSNTTSADTTVNSSVTAFNSNGISLGSDNGVNQNSVSYVGWQWDAGSSTVTNTNGTISSQVRANPTAGFSVVSYTGTGANATVGHGLGVAPSFIITFCRSVAGNSHNVYHKSLTANGGIYLDLNNAYAASAVFWNNTAPTASVFSLGTSGNANTNGATNVAYCFAEIAGYSKFGSYTGNGSADGPFVHCGFRPKFVMWKRTDVAESWVIEDTSRNTFNVTIAKLYAQDVSGEDTNATYGLLDILSNGFKCRTSHAQQNASGGTYIYMAFAENPFKNALAR